MAHIEDENPVFWGRRFGSNWLPLPGSDGSASRAEAPGPGRCLVLTIGTFDVLHFGHVAFLRQCARLGTDLVVGVNTDRFVTEFKPPAVMDQAERVHALRQLGYAARLNDGPGRDLIADVRPDVLAIGSDWARKDYLAQVGVDQDWLDERKVILAYVPYVQDMPISTTEIRRRITEREHA